MWVISILLLLSFASQTAGANIRLDRPGSDYYRGNMTWDGLKREVVWGPGVEEAVFIDPTPESSSLPLMTPPPVHFNFLSHKLPVDLHLNASRFLQVNFVVRPATNPQQTYCYYYSYQYDVELLLDGTFIGGGTPQRGGTYSNADPAFKSFRYNSDKGTIDASWDESPELPSGLCLLSYRITAEQAAWSAGSVLQIKITSWLMPNDDELVFGGAHGSHVAIPIYNADERVFRLDGSTAKPPEAAADEGPVGLALLAVGAAMGAMARRRTVLLVAAILIGSGLAGCLASPGDPASPDDGEAPKGTIQPTYADAPELEKSGRLLGRVVDTYFRPVAQAHLQLVGTSIFASSNGQGRFSVENITPGSYDLQVQKEGFHTFRAAQPLAIVAGKSAYVDVTLRALGESPDKPHTHNYFDGDTKKLLDREPIGRACDLGRTCIPVTFMLPPGSEEVGPKTILPGTDLMEVTVHWTGQLPRVALHFVSPTDRIPFCSGSCPSYFGDTYFNETRLFPRGPGETFRVPINWEMSEAGHQLTSNYIFLVQPVVDPTAGALAVADLSVTIVLHRGGRMPVEPAHRDFWKDGETLQVLSDRKPAPFCAACVNIQAPFVTTSSSAGNTSWIPDIIPPGTEWLEIDLVQSKSSVGDGFYDWVVSYKAADTYSPKLCKPDFRSADVQYFRLGAPTKTDANSLGWHWNLRLSPEQADPFYAVAGNWCFWTAPGDRSLSMLDFWAKPAQGEVTLSMTVRAHNSTLPA